MQDFFLSGSSDFLQSLLFELKPHGNYKPPWNEVWQMYALLYAWRIALIMQSKIIGSNIFEAPPIFIHAFFVCVFLFCFLFGFPTEQDNVCCLSPLSITRLCSLRDSRLCLYISAMLFLLTLLPHIVVACLFWWLVFSSMSSKLPICFFNLPALCLAFGFYFQT